MTDYRTGIIVTVGTELVRGLSVDTNTAEIAHALLDAGIDVAEAVSVGDDPEALTAVLARSVAASDLVIVTGGLGPTHDDLTREAASRALGIPLHRDAGLEDGLRSSAGRHLDPRAAQQVFAQADVLAGATVLPAIRGTAPGQVIPTQRGSLVLLPGPPGEMRPMLHGLTSGWRTTAAEPRILRCSGLSESDAQLAAQDVLQDAPGIELTVLAQPGDVRIVLFDRGAGATRVDAQASEIAARLGDACYSTDGSSLAQVVVARARDAGVTLATAESCTGGLVGAALTTVPGASDSYLGGVVSYADEAKVTLLGIDPALIATFGAISDAVARAMAAGARDVLGADFAISVTGVAGPGGGSPDKPTGTVWFGVAGPDSVEAQVRRFPGDRESVRARATATALDLLRRSLPDA